RRAGCFNRHRFSGFRQLAALSPVASTAATATTTTTVPFAFGFRTARAAWPACLAWLDVLVLGLVVDLERLLFELFLFLDGGRFGPRHRDWARTRALDAHPRALEALVDLDVDHHAVALLDIGKLAALLVEDVDRGFLAGAQTDALAAPARRLILQHPQCGQSRRRRGAH